MNGIYFGCTIPIYVIIYKIGGYNTWDSSVIHTPEVIPKYGLSTLIPGIIFTFLTIRAYHLKWTNWNIQTINTGWKGKLERNLTIIQLLMGTTGHYVHLDSIYLIRHYMLFITVTFCLCIFIAQGSWTFIIPTLFQIRYVTEFNWLARFQVLTVELITLPLLIADCILLHSWGTARLRTSAFDAVYRLKIEKDISRNGRENPLHSILRENNQDLVDIQTTVDLIDVKSKRKKG